MVQSNSDFQYLAQHSPLLWANPFPGELAPKKPNDEGAMELLRNMAGKPSAPARRGRAAKAI